MPIFSHGLVGWHLVNVHQRLHDICSNEVSETHGDGFVQVLLLVLVLELEHHQQQLHGLALEQIKALVQIEVLGECQHTLSLCLSVAHLANVYYLLHEVWQVVNA